MRAIALLPFAIFFLGCDIHRQLGDDLRVEPVAPLASAGTGSINSPLAGRPTLRWTSSSQAQTYHLQVDDSCTAAVTCDFPSPEIDEAALTTTFYVPASALPGSSTAPFIRRYYWRVQACKGDSCGEWSVTRVFVVGQERTLNRDINGDGYADFLVGAKESNVVARYAGQASVFFGGATLPSRPAWVLTGNVESDRLGFGVAMAGDVNGDGYGDYLVRAQGNLGTPLGAGGTQVGSQGGRIMVFFGGPNLKSQPDVVFPAEMPGTLNDFTNGTMVGCGDSQWRWVRRYRLRRIRLPEWQSTHHTKPSGDSFWWAGHGVLGAARALWRGSGPRRQRERQFRLLRVGHFGRGRRQW